MYNRKSFFAIIITGSLIYLSIPVSAVESSSSGPIPEANILKASDYPISAARYVVFLNDNPKIREAITWRLNGEKISLSKWDDENRRLFFSAVEGVENGLTAPLDAPPKPLIPTRSTLNEYLQKKLDKSDMESSLEYMKAHLNCPGEEVAKNIFFHHVAFDLKAELDRRFSWSLTALDSSELSMLFDYESLYPMIKVSTFCFDEETHWNPGYTYDFMKNNNIVKSTQKDTIIALTEWFRNYLVHADIRLDLEEKSFHDINMRMWGRPGMPEVEMILQGSTLEGKGPIHYTRGCPATNRLYREMLRVLNIPVRFGKTVLLNGPHSRAEFPTIGLGLMHSDDPYLLLVSQPEIPTSRIFLPIQDLETMSNPQGRDCKSGDDECYMDKKRKVEYNYRKFFLDLNVEYNTLYLLVERAKYSPLDPVFSTYFSDYIKGIGESWEMLAGDIEVKEGTPILGAPFFNDREVEVIIHRVDAKIAQLGNGDWYRGAEMAVSMFTKVQHDGYCMKQFCQRTEMSQKHKNGLLMFHGTYVGGMKINQWTGWHENGQKKYEGHFIDGMKTGKWTWWHENGNISIEAEYKEDRRDGIWKSSAADGRVMMVGEYEDGVFHGEIRDLCYIGGEKLQEWTFSDGQGTLVSWFENGKMQSSEEFKAELLNTIASDECGAKGKNGFFTNFRRHGTTIAQDNDGNIVDKKQYHEGSVTPPEFRGK